MQSWLTSKAEVTNTYQVNKYNIEPCNQIMFIFC